jgi:hypothetical protein
MRWAAQSNNLFLEKLSGALKIFTCAGLPFGTALALELIEFLKDKQI